MHSVVFFKYRHELVTLLPMNLDTYLAYSNARTGSSMPAKTLHARFFLDKLLENRVGVIFAVQCTVRGLFQSEHASFVS